MNIRHKEDSPLVSIGVPTYNRPALLSKVLNCLIAQTYQNLEIVVSDNCTPGPEVKSILYEFQEKDKRVRGFIQPQNFGSTHNWKFVLEKSAGKYFMWLSDDDLISERFIEEAVNFLEANEDYSMASGMPFWMDQEITKRGPLPVIALENNNRRKRIFSYIFHVEDNCVFYSLFRRSHINHIYPLPVYPGNDWLMVIRLLYLGKSKILPAANVYKNIGGISHDIKSFARAFNCSAFWIKHRMFTLYRYLLLDIFKSNYLGTTFFEKNGSLCSFSLACLFRGIYDWFHKWFYMIFYRRYIKQYFFHIFYLILPEKVFSELKTIKQRTTAAVLKIFKK